MVEALESDDTNENVASQLKRELPKLPENQFWRVRKESQLNLTGQRPGQVLWNLANTLVAGGAKKDTNLRLELREHIVNQQV